MFSKSLVSLNILLALAGLVLGVQVSENLQTNYVNLPELKTNFHRFELSEDVLKLSYAEVPVYKKQAKKQRKPLIKKKVATVVKKEANKEIKFLGASKKEIQIINYDYAKF